MKKIYYGWTMIILSIIVLLVFAAVSVTFGIFIKPLTAEFNWDRGALSLAVTMRSIMSGVLGVLITGKLCDKYGPRFLVTTSGICLSVAFFLMSRVTAMWQVYLIYIFLVGTGSACCYLPVMATISRWFIHKRGLAVGLAAVGFTAGGIINPVVAQWIISNYGWRTAFIVLSITNLVVLPVAGHFMHHSPQRIGLQPLGYETVNNSYNDKPTPVTGLTLNEALKTARFWIIGVIILCFTFSYEVMLVHLAPYATDIGIQKMVAASLVSVLSGVGIGGKLLTGMLSDKIDVKKLITYGLIILVVSLALLMVNKALWSLYIFSALFGFAYGAIVTLQNISPAALFGIKSVGAILAGLMLFGAVGGAAGAPVAGLIFDKTGSYQYAFLICLILSILAFVLSLVLLRLKEMKIQAKLVQ